MFFSDKAGTKKIVEGLSTTVYEVRVYEGGTTGRWIRNENI